VCTNASDSPSLPALSSRAVRTRGSDAMPATLMVSRMATTSQRSSWCYCCCEETVVLIVQGAPRLVGLTSWSRGSVERAEGPRVCHPMRYTSNIHSCPLRSTYILQLVVSTLYLPYHTVLTHRHTNNVRSHAPSLYAYPATTTPPTTTLTLLPVRPTLLYVLLHSVSSSHLSHS
jgi:hypothetical protein